MDGRLVALAVADEPVAWQGAGFAIDEGGRCWLGDVGVTLTPGTGKGVQAWSVDGIDAPVDGLPTIDLPPAEPVGATTLHPNGTTVIDHVVVATPDLDRTVAALEATGLEARRVREADSGGRHLRQVFFRPATPCSRWWAHPSRRATAPPGSSASPSPWPTWTPPPPPSASTSVRSRTPSNRGAASPPCAGRPAAPPPSPS
jgi:hypothetical protein